MAIPFSNPAGNNGFTPKASPIMPISGGFPGSTIENPGSNPFSPIVGGPRPRAFSGGIPMSPTGITPGSVTGVTDGAYAPDALGLTQTTDKELAGGTASLQKHITDIWGQGIGGALDNLLKNMSGVDSKVLQEFINSLQPQEAKASANVSANLGAAGVGANSSVNAIAQADLQGQEFAAISNESAKLTMSQEQLTAQILEEMMNPAAKEVATSGWSVFADVMSNITGDVGNLLHGGAKTGSNAGNPTGGDVNYIGGPGTSGGELADYGGMGSIPSGGTELDAIGF